MIPYKPGWIAIDPLEEAREIDLSNFKKANYPRFIKKIVLLPLWKNYIGWKRFFIIDWWRLKLS